MEEVEELRGEAARVFEDEEERSHVVQLHNSPISFRDDDDSWTAIDSTIVPTDGGYTNAANLFRTFFPDTLTPERPVEITYPEGKLTFWPIGSRATNAVAGDVTVTYPGTHPGVDTAFNVTPEGVKETTVIAAPEGPRRFRYRIETDGLALSLEDDGEILVLSGSEAVGVIPRSFAFDSSRDPDSGLPSTTYEVATELSARGPGAYELDLEIPRGWFSSEDRVFPVTLDPTVVRTRCDTWPDPCPQGTGAPWLKDTWADSESPWWYTPHTQPRLKMGMFRSALGYTGMWESATYMTFDVRQQIRHVGDIVYESKFNVYNESYTDQTVTQGPGLFQLRRVTHDWDQASVNWNARPNVDSKVWATHNGCSASGNCANGWLEWDTRGLMQFWMDFGVPSNHGWELTWQHDPYNYNATGKLLASGENIDPSGGVSRRPYINVWVNAMPGTKAFVMDDPDWPKLELANDALPNGTSIETMAPLLKIKDLTDHNGDPIVVRYQVSRSQTNFNGNVVYDSGWLPEKDSHRVPSGYLTDGTYYWRVQASDICPEQYVDPDSLDRMGVNVCDDLSHLSDRSGVGMRSERPVSEIRSFSIKKHAKNLGYDKRWWMWRQELGNRMDLRVNAATGNVVFDYPIDEIGTPQRPLNIKLVYNGQKAQQVNGGVNTRPAGLPAGWDVSAGPATKPEQMPARVETLGYQTPAGRVAYGVAVTYESGKRETFIEAGDGVYGQVGPLAGTIRAQSDGGWLLTTYSGGTFLFSSTGALVKARPSTTSPAAPGYDYTAGPDGNITSVTDPLGRRVEFEYETIAGLSGPTLRRIVAFASEPIATRSTWTLGYANGSLTTIQDPEGQTVTLGYTSSRLSSILDGEESAKPSGTGKPTYIEYDANVLNASRAVVSKIRLPVVDTVRPIGARDATDPYKATPTTPAWEFAYNFASSNSDFARTTTVTSPRGGYTTGDTRDYQMIIDFNDLGLPIMQQGPRVGDPPQWMTTTKVWDFKTGNLLCKRGPAANASGTTTCGASDGRQTQYTYQQRAPYLLTKVTRAAAAANGPRLTQTYAYDEGFKGLQTHYFKNTTLTGLPDGTDISPTVSADWGDAGPAPFPDRSEFSVRYFGELVPQHSTGTRDHEFRLTAEDDARLLVDGKILLDCITTVSGTTCNGGTQQTATASALPTTVVPIAVELKAVSGPARVKLEWKQTNGTWAVVPEANLRPMTDVLTSVAEGTTALPAEPGAFSRTTHVYPDASHKIRGLPATERTVGGSRSPGTTPREVSFTYDDHGRIRRETDATGVPIIHDYTGACETLTLDRAGLETTRTCSVFGDVLTETAHVGGILDGNGASPGTNDRQTTTTYTKLGQIDTVTNAEGGFVDYNYDRAGRLVQEIVTREGGPDRITDYIRNERGWLMREVLPDPDGAGGAARATVQYRYDDGGNTIVTIDQRGKTWINEYDAANNRTMKTDPLGNKWIWTIDRTGRVSSKQDPHLSRKYFTWDDYDRLLSVQLLNLEPEETRYDERGLVMREETPDNIAATFEYDAFGKVLKQTIPGGAKTYEYDGSGFLTKRTDFRGNPTFFTYDDMGHLESVQLPHEGRNTTMAVLNEAGESEVIKRPADQVNVWITTALDYDLEGNVVEETDAQGNAWTYRYDTTGELLETLDPRGYRITSEYDGIGKEERRRTYDEVDGVWTLLGTIDYTYDAAGNVKSASNAAGTVGITYDDVGRIEKVEAGGKDTTFAYNKNRLVSRTDAAGTTSYDYYAGTGRIHTVTDPITGSASTFHYKPSGKLQDHTDTTGLTTTYAYDAAGRLETKTVKDAQQNVIASFSSTYNADSQVTSRTRTVGDGTFAGPDNGTWTYAYDGAGRLRTATDPDNTLFRYGYDGAGNRTLVEEVRTQNDVTVTSSIKTVYNDRSHPVSSTETVTSGDVVVGVPLETTYGHDAAGNLTDISGPGLARTFAYDALGRLRFATHGLPGAVSPLKYAYTYDAYDRTVRKDTVGTAAGVESVVAQEHSWYAGLDHELVQSKLETNPATEAITTSYTSRHGMPYAVRKQSGAVDPVTGAPAVTTTSFLGTDPHGDVVYSTNGGGDLQSSRSFDPWGSVRTEVGESSDLGFQSDHTDPDIGVVDMGARHYLPELGRFLTADPLRGEGADPLSMNRYTYGEGDPVSTTDPQGTRVYCEGEWCGDDEAFTLESSSELAGHTRSVSADGPIVDHEDWQPEDGGIAGSLSSILDAAPDANWTYSRCGFQSMIVTVGFYARTCFAAEIESKGEIPGISFDGSTGSLSIPIGDGGIVDTNIMRIIQTESIEAEEQMRGGGLSISYGEGVRSESITPGGLKRTGDISISAGGTARVSFSPLTWTLTYMVTGVETSEGRVSYGFKATIVPYDPIRRPPVAVPSAWPLTNPSPEQLHAAALTAAAMAGAYAAWNIAGSPRMRY